MKTPKLSLILLAVLSLSSLAFSQGGLYQDRAEGRVQFSPYGNALVALPGATVTVCTDSTCATPVTLYSNVALTIPFSTPSNVAFADLNGNFSFYAAPGIYWCTVRANGFAALSRACQVSTTTAVNGVFTSILTGSIDSVLYVDGVRFTTIQAAINALPSSGGTVIIPPGNYALTDTALNKSNVTVRGSGMGTHIQPSGGAGHYAFVMGEANPSNSISLQVRDLQIDCPGGTDQTGGIFVRKGVSVGTVIENVRFRSVGNNNNGGSCGTNVQWGETAGGSIGSFDGVMSELDMDLTNTQIGIHISNGPNGPNGLTIERCSIRNGTLDPGLSQGILIEGQAFRTSIINNYIEFMPGGDIVLRSTNGTMGNTIITNNYMETFGSTGLLLDIGTGVIDTVYRDNYSNSNTAPNATYDIQIANGATGVLIENQRLQNHGTANIHNLNTSAGANIVLRNVNITGSTSPLFDSPTGIIQQNYLGGFPQVIASVADNALRVQNTNAGGFGAKFIPGANGNYGIAVTDSTGATNNFIVNGDGTVSTNGPIQLSGKSLLIPTAPTISSGFGTSPSIVNSNGAVVFEVNVGTGGVATSGVLGLPTATNGWACLVQDMNTNIVTRQTAFTVSSVTVTGASAWTASDKLLLHCEAF